MQSNITKIALDTHKKQHTVAWVNCDTGQTDIFSVNNNKKDITRMVNRLKKMTKGSQLQFCYEAGVCGFTLKRRLEELDCHCDVIAPSLIPIKPGERIKNDRRDARNLLMHFTSDQLTVVAPPNQQEEAAREITRCREAAQKDRGRSRHRILKFLTRHGYQYKDGKHWTQKHDRWLRQLEFDNSDLKRVFDLMFTELTHCDQRLDSLDSEVQALADRPEYKALVGCLRCFKGIDTLTAITIITELFDFGRFRSARSLMAYLGVTPSEHSSGESKHMGAITKTGNRRIRRLLVESGWHYRHRFYVGPELKARRKNQPQWAIDKADHAMTRLYKRYYRSCSYESLLH